MNITGTDQIVHETAHPPRGVLVLVNRHEVLLPERKMTGLEIKQEAIEQGAELEIGFQLSVKNGSHYDVIGDTDEVNVHKGQEFIAVAPDDNS